MIFYLVHNTTKLQSFATDNFINQKTDSIEFAISDGRIIITVTIILCKYVNTAAIKPHGEKTSKMINSSVIIESGRCLFPAESRNLNWRPEFKKGLLGFPETKYKDQVDALNQVIRYILDE